MHPQSRPHRLLGKEQLSRADALEFDRTVLAAARKRRAFTAQGDLAKPGDFGIDAIIKLLARMSIEG